MVKMDYVWDRTVEFLGDHLSAVLPFAVIGVFVPTSIMNAIAPLWQGAGQGLKSALALVTVALVIILFWGYLAITALAVDPAVRRGVGGAAGGRLLPMLAVYLVLILGLVVLVLPIGLLAAMSGMDMAAMQAGTPVQLTSPAIGWLLALYMLAFLAVVLVAAARLIPLGAVIVAERRGVGAIARAWRMTRGLTWRLIGVAILYFVVSQVAGLAARTVFGSILRFTSRGDGPITVGNVITAIIVAAVSAGFTTLAAVFAAKLYVAIQTMPAPVAAPVAGTVTGHVPESDAALS